MVTKRQGGFPVQNSRCTKAIFSPRISHHMGRSVHGTAFQSVRLGKDWGFAQRVGLQGSVRLWKVDRGIHLTEGLSPNNGGLQVLSSDVDARIPDRLRPIEVLSPLQRVKI